MSSRIGVIAEDDTDFEVIRTIVHRELGSAVGVTKKVANGCAKIPLKAGIWLRELAARGCGMGIVLHDLDRNPRTNALNDEDDLYRRIESVTAPTGIRRLICIPSEELEAWFWADEMVLQKVAHGVNCKAHSSPHNISKPKEALLRLSLGENGKERYSTNTNPQLAAILNFDVCASRCPAFAKLRQFLRTAVI